MIGFHPSAIPMVLCFFYLGAVLAAGDKPAIVLVHGAFQTAAAWSVESKLTSKGYRVITVNLPGRDGDGTDPQKLATEVYKQAVLKAVSAENKRFGRVPKFYIETTKDLIASPALQERMMQGAGIQHGFKINAGHASYITRPDQVVAAISQAVEKSFPEVVGR